MLAIKIRLEDDTRRFECDENVGWEELRKMIQSLFELKDGTFEVKYKDDEDDLVSLSCNIELEEAKNVARIQNILRLEVSLLNKDSLQKEKPQTPFDSIEPKNQEEKPLILFEPSEKAEQEEKPQIWFEREKKIDDKEKDVDDKEEDVDDKEEDVDDKEEEPCSEKTPCEEGEEEEILKPVWKDFCCDQCQSIIAGCRYQCVNCPDYDLCESCEAKLGVEFNHPEDHLFLKYRKPPQPLQTPDLNKLLEENKKKFEIDLSKDVDAQIAENKEKLETFLNEMENYSQAFLDESYRIHQEAKQFQESYKERVREQRNHYRALAQQFKQHGKKFEDFVSKMQDEAVEKKQELLAKERQQAMREALKKKIEEDKKKQQEQEKQNKKETKKPSPLPKDATKYDEQHSQLIEMGFVDNAKNQKLLVKFKGDLPRVIRELLKEAK